LSLVIFTVSDHKSAVKISSQPFSEQHPAVLSLVISVSVISRMLWQ